MTQPDACPSGLGTSFFSKGLKFDAEHAFFFAIYITLYCWGKSIFEVTKHGTLIQSHKDRSQGHKDNRQAAPDARHFVTNDCDT